jgi:hypothetical protein
MKTKKDFTYGRAILFGVATELVLVLIQYLLLAVYQMRNPGTPFSFNNEYMLSNGFYAFLIPGFILYATVVFLIMQKFTITSPAFLLVFLLAAAVVEVGFYLSIAADYRGPFLYSVLDKVIGTALGVIGYYAIGKSSEVG